MAAHILATRVLQEYCSSVTKSIAVVSQEYCSNVTRVGFRKEVGGGGEHWDPPPEISFLTGALMRACTFAHIYIPSPPP